MGALFRLPHLVADDVGTSNWVASSGITLWATDVKGETVLGEGVAERLAIVLGNEGAGVRDEWLARADRLVSIPIRPDAESLNVAVAAGIMLWEVARGG